MEKKLIVFLIKFFIIFSVLHFIIWSVDLSFLQIPLTRLEGKLLNIKTIENTLIVNENIFEINPSCTGLVSTSILAAIIFALKKPRILKKIQIFLIGAITLLIANIARIFIVLWFGLKFGIKTAEIVHVISWFTTSGIIIIAWYYFTKKITKIKAFNELL
jgi:exosortase/archaeosortase family protein